MIERSSDNRLPLWLRIVALGVEKADDHVATFQLGELHRTLDPFDLGLSRSLVTRAIASGITYGMLAPGSNTRRLILVPGSLTTEVGNG